MTAPPVQKKTKRPRQSSDLKPVINESGIEVKTLYTLEDVIRSGGIDQSAPGDPPFTRGIHSEMYRRRPWTMRQYTGFANAADTNKRFKYLIENGQTGLNVAFDLATQCGTIPTRRKHWGRSAASAWPLIHFATLRSPLTASTST